METRKDRTAIIALIAGAIALLLGLCMGALGGGIAGYLIGRQTGEKTQSDTAPSLRPEAPDLSGGVMRVSGALIGEVVPDSPAAAAGLQVNDLITRINNVPVDANHPLAAVVGTLKPGDRVKLTVLRGDETLTVNLTAGKHPDNPTQAFLGIYYEYVSMQMRKP